MYNESNTSEQLIQLAQKKILNGEHINGGGQEIVNLFESALILNPDCILDPSHREAYASILAIEGYKHQESADHEQAIVMFSSAIKFCPSNTSEGSEGGVDIPGLLRLRRVSYQAIGNQQAAQKDLKEATSMEKAETFIRSARSEYNNQKNNHHKNYQEAQDNFECAIQLTPYINYLLYKTDTDFLYEMGNLYQAQSNPERAIQCFTLLINLDPSECNAYKLRRSSYLVLDNDQAANQDMNDIKRLSLKNEIDVEEFTFGNQILGQGNAGIVFNGFYGKIPVAIKKPLYTASKKGSTGCLKTFKAELKCLTALSHPNIVPLLAVYRQSNNHFFLLFELMTHGSLFSVLKNMAIDLPWTLRISIAKDITRALQYLHEQNMLHRSIKSPNILLSDRMVAKITDFGRAIHCDDATDSDSIGNWHWAAPEILIGYKNTKPSDCFSLGSVLSEIASRKIPFDALSSRSERSLIIKGKRAEIPPQTPVKYASIIKYCWQRDPNLRPSAQDILEKLSDIDLITTPPPSITKNTAIEMKNSGLKLFSGTAHFFANHDGKNLRSNSVPYYSSATVKR